MNSTETKTSWTPGPWQVKEKTLAFAEGVYGPKSPGRDRNWIADTGVGNDAEREANTRLISKAPDMAELLNKADRLLTQCYSILCDDAIANRIPFGLKESVHEFVVGNKAGILLAEIGGDK